MKNNMLILLSFTCALLFGFGLGMAGMLNPANVLGFLDILGDWKPALMLVMGAGILVAMPLFMLTKKLKKPAYGDKFHLPPQGLEAKIIIGSIIFGIGWGLAGICPGPALAILAIKPMAILPFIIAMIAGGGFADFIMAKLPKPFKIINQGNFD